VSYGVFDPMPSDPATAHRHGVVSPDGMIEPPSFTTISVAAFPGQESRFIFGLHFTLLV
jgi:hypothetical protein